MFRFDRRGVAELEAGEKVAEQVDDWRVTESDRRGQLLSLARAKGRDLQRIERSTSFRVIARPPTLFSAFRGRRARSSLYRAASETMDRTSLKV